MKSVPPAAGQGFPRIYRVDARTRRVVNFLLAALASLIFVILPLCNLIWTKPHASSFSSLIGVDLGFALFLLWLGSGYNKRVILRQDSIEVAGWFYSRKLNFAEIRGRRGPAGYYGAYHYILVPFDDNKRPLALPPFLHTDEFFRDWIKTVPKLARKSLRQNRQRAKSE
ncbi:MAG TPA: hypothetical protein VGU63_11735 [Candidatus Acidoferrales bacterium]|nr:hypothetical protein [Candidatus Acidoferrales bacterium]